MRIKYLVTLLILYSSFVNAETLLKVFYSEKLVLPDSCYFIARGGNENDFTCPNSTDPFRSISFPLVDKFEESISQSKIEELNENAKTENMDFSFEPVITAVIDKRKHYLSVWELAGKSHQSYTICDHRSCVKISAMELDFVRNIVEQFSTKTIYDLE
jgi:hypothetical protein